MQIPFEMRVHTKCSGLKTLEKLSKQQLGSRKKSENHRGHCGQRDLIYSFIYLYSLMYWNICQWYLNCWNNTVVGSEFQCPRTSLVIPANHNSGTLAPWCPILLTMDWMLSCAARMYDPMEPVQSSGIQSPSLHPMSEINIKLGSLTSTTSFKSFHVPKLAIPTNAKSHK